MFKLQAQNFYEVIADNAKGQIIEIGRARTVYKGLYNWRTAQTMPLLLTAKEVQINKNESK